MWAKIKIALELIMELQNRSVYSEEMYSCVKWIFKRDLKKCKTYDEVKSYEDYIDSVIKAQESKISKLSICE